jgi:hypothetical protein
VIDIQNVDVAKSTHWFWFKALILPRELTNLHSKCDFRLAKIQWALIDFYWNLFLICARNVSYSKCRCCTGAFTDFYSKSSFRYRNSLIFFQNIDFAKGTHWFLFKILILLRALTDIYSKHWFCQGRSLISIQNIDVAKGIHWFLFKSIDSAKSIHWFQFNVLTLLRAFTGFYKVLILLKAFTDFDSKHWFSETRSWIQNNVEPRRNNPGPELQPRTQDLSSSPGPRIQEQTRKN